MANNTVTINKVLAIFRDLSIRHEMINDFGFGETADIGASRPMLFPYMWVEPTTTRISQGVTANRYQELFYSFNIYLMDKIQKGDDNFEDTLSDTNYILATIVREMSQHPYYVDMSISLAGDIVFEPATEATDDNVNGWIAQFTLKIPLRYGYCETPIEAISGWTSSLTPQITQYRLIGQTGAQGPQGAAGATGLDGSAGSTGPQGAFGPTGLGGALGAYGGFYSSIDQPLLSITQSQVITLNGTYESNQVSITSGSRITFANPGTYQLTFVGQVSNLSNSAENAVFWIKYNGNDWPNSGTEVSLPARKSAGVPSKQLVTVAFVGTAQNAGDYVELWWAGESLDLSLTQEPQNLIDGSAEVPSMIVSIIQVMYTQVGPQGYQGATGPNDLGLQDVLINDSYLVQNNSINSGGYDLQFRNHTLFEVTQTQDINLSVTNINNIEANDGSGNISSLNLQGAQYDLKAQSGGGQYTSVYGTDNKLFFTTGGVYNGTVNIGDFLQLVGPGGQVEFAPISSVSGPTGPAGPQGATGPTANLTFQQTLINGATLSQNNQVDLNNTNFTWNKPDRFIITGTSSTSGDVYTTAFNFRSAANNEVIGMSIVNQSGLTGSGIQVNRTSLQIRTPKVVNNTATVNQVLTLDNVNGQVEYKDVSTLVPARDFLTYVTATNSTAYATSSTVALYSVKIPANTVAGGDMIYIQTRTTKVGTAAVYRSRMYANSTNNVSTATLLGDLLTTAATSVYVQFERVMVVKSSTGASNNQMFPTGTTNAFTDNAATTVTTTPTIDWTNDVYIMIAYTPVTGTADQIRGSFVRIEIEKGNV